jgi:hypothetical protein
MELKSAKRMHLILLQSPLLNKQFSWSSFHFNRVLYFQSRLCFCLQVKESTWSDGPLTKSYSQSLATLWVTICWKTFSLYNCKLWYNMNFVSWVAPTSYSYLTNELKSGHVVPVLNGNYRTPKWDTLSLKYKCKVLGKLHYNHPLRGKFHQKFHQRLHYNESMQICALPFQWKTLSNIHTHHSLSLL